MLASKIKVGMKVVPHNKSTGHYSYKEFLNAGFEVPVFFRKNKYLYVIIKSENCDTVHLGYKDCPYDETFDFLAKDFEPYWKNPAKIMEID